MTDLHVVATVPDDPDAFARAVRASDDAAVLPLLPLPPPCGPALQGATVITLSRKAPRGWQDLADLLWRLAPRALVVHGARAGLPVVKAARWLELPAWVVPMAEDGGNAWDRARLRWALRGVVGLVGEARGLAAADVPVLGVEELGGALREVAGRRRKNNCQIITNVDMVVSANR